MNTANETLRAVRHQKATITKRYNNAVKRCNGDEETLKKIDDRFVNTMKKLDSEEKKLLRQLKVME